MSDNETTETHPSFGQLEIGRVTSSQRVPLYGTSNQCRETIRLSIHESELHRSLNRFWHFSKKTLIEIDMSPAQFAEAITSLNNGSGTPVTIKYVNGKEMPPPPYEDTRDLFDQEFKKDIRDINAETNSAIDKVKAIINKKTVSKKELNEVISGLEGIQRELNKNMPFVAKSFSEHMDKVMSSVKIEVDAFIDSKIRGAGIEALKQSAPSMEIEEKTQNITKIFDSACDLSQPEGDKKDATK
jgi:hypothetical protein